MKTARLNFNEVPNPLCLTKCNKEMRQKMTEDDLCINAYSVIDHLPVRCVGEWAVQKIFHLIQYFGIFSTGMKDKWDGRINYIEICSGTGRCINRTTGTEFNGTAICILEHESFKYLNHAIFIDYNKTVVNTLNNRIQDRNITKAKAILGNYNDPTEICKNILNETNGLGLNLVFIDPTDCSVPFALLKEIKDSLQHVDFIINIAIGTDVNRNIRNSILSPDSHKTVKEKYITFLGTDSYFNDPEAIDFARKGNHVELRRLFREEYTKNLRLIGYNHFDFKSIENYYDLIFASSHIKGIEFWQKANAIKIDGQRSLF